MSPPIHCAPTELWKLKEPGVYKHFIPPGCAHENVAENKKLGTCHAENSRDTKEAIIRTRLARDHFRSHGEPWDIIPTLRSCIHKGDSRASIKTFALYLRHSGSFRSALKRADSTGGRCHGQDRQAGDRHA